MKKVTNYFPVPKEVHAGLNVVVNVREREQTKELAAARIGAAKERSDRKRKTIFIMLIF